MNVLSLFDGISCGQVGLKIAGIRCERYTASEIDKNAIRVTMNNYPETVHVGDARGVSGKEVGRVDLLIGGPPCQDLSIANSGRTGLGGDRSVLFWEYVRIMNETRPRWFIMENVASMRHSDRDKISEVLGVSPIMIDAALVSAQSRQRLFWTNIPNIIQPHDRGVALRDIMLPNDNIEPDRFISILSARNSGTWYESRRSFNQESLVPVPLHPVKVGHFGKGGQGQRVYSTSAKSVTLTVSGGGLGKKTGLYRVGEFARGLEPIECERLQGLPDLYTLGVSRSVRLKLIGNGFNAHVVAHILSHIPS